MKGILMGIYGSLLLIMLGNCKKEEPKRLTRDDISKKKEVLVRVNKYLVKKDVELIESYAKRRGWEMELTESGLFYQIYERGNGKKSENGKYATIAYKLSLLDGTLCYSSEEQGPKKLQLGHSNEESGLEQGILLMHVGDKARLILPPHLAHGLLGDENRIPARSIIVYEIELLDITN
jgi:FKBP-type peptidyl-prolyl cis-trans isomerase FkpA